MPAISTAPETTCPTASAAPIPAFWRDPRVLERGRIAPRLFGHDELLPRLHAKSQSVQETGALARSFPQLELRRYLRKDPTVGIVLRSCLEEMEAILNKSSAPFVIRSDIRVDSD